MLCTCEIEGKKESEKLKIDVRRILGCKPSDLCLSVLLYLAWVFKAEIHITVDMWYMVNIKTNDFDRSIECDDPLDGLCFLFKMLAELHPEMIKSGNVLDNNIEKISEIQLGEYERVLKESEFHLDSCTCEDKGHHKKYIDLCNKVWACEEELTNKWNTGIFLIKDFSYK